MKPKPTLHEHKTAPGELALVHAFLNTWHADGPRERWENPERLRDWLAKRALIPQSTPVSQMEFDSMRCLRDGLRQLIAASGAKMPRAQLDKLNKLARDAHLVVHFDADGKPRLMPEDAGMQVAMARIFASVSVGQFEGTWSRLKLCRNIECQRVFYDTSKNHSAVWCSSQRCGNRMNARAYRARMQQEGGG
jgi:predicted RNA-binding Zn ribbon-like protein